jgi:hypothetical protein
MDLLGFLLKVYHLDGADVDVWGLDLAKPNCELQNNPPSRPLYSLDLNKVTDP